VPEIFLFLITTKNECYKDAMTPDKDESAQQGQTRTQTVIQAQSAGAGTGAEIRPIEAPTVQTGQGNNKLSTPSSGSISQESKPKVYLAGTEGLVWDIQGAFWTIFSLGIISPAVDFSCGWPARTTED
jgi:hypothetical protein